MLRPLSDIFSTQEYPNLLVGLDSPDDSAVYQLDENRAIISTTDFFPPVVDDPYHFGAIAAANALSDVYAMGGRPFLAINLVAFPDGLDLDILTEILRGGAEKVKEAGAIIAGGHTVTDKEPKYGLSVIGDVHPNNVIKKSGARVGDKLILTKPLGTGVITTALKRGDAETDHVDKAVATMSLLNKTASELAQEFQVHAMTDITGYSLLGHAHEMAHLGQVRFEITFAQLRWLEGAMDYARADIFPGGMHRNRDYFLKWVTIDHAIAEHQEYLLYDPQTSGGLLMSVAPDQCEDLLEKLIAKGEQASVIGTVLAGNGEIIITST